MNVKIETQTFIATIILLSLFISYFSFSQEAEIEKKNKDIRGYLMLGGSRLDIDVVNDRLVSKGYSSFSDEYFSIGGGFLSKTNSRWLIGVEGHYLFNEEKDNVIPNGNYKTLLTTAYGFFDVGYDLVSTEDLNIYPLMGFGLGFTWLKIGKNNFDDILSDPERNAELYTGTFLLNFAFGFDYLLKTKEYEKNKGGLVLGFRVGYTYAPWKGGWWTDMIDIDNGPKIGMTGPYMRFMIGFGGKGEWWKEEKNNEE
jgi:hypothetical protein